MAFKKADKFYNDLKVRKKETVVQDGKSPATKGRPG
jgi:hypothetical protein